MQNDEALNPVEPHSKMGAYGGKFKRGAVKRALRGYFYSICLLFLLIVILCSYSLIIYKSYYNTKTQNDINANKIKAILASSNNQGKYEEGITEENRELHAQNKEMEVENNKIFKILEEIKRQNDELIKRNNELQEDNIALQNSLKMAASVGIKPQSYKEFSGISSKGELERGKYVGKFLGTAYTPSSEECGNNEGITNSGKPIIPGVSLAVDGGYWPFGTVFYIKGLGYVVAMDSGSAIKGKYRFDFAVFDKKFAQILGSRYWEVYLVKLGNGQISDIKL